MIAALVAVGLTFSIAQAGEHPEDPGDIVAVAAGAGDFNTLVSAIEAAGLVEALQGEGPFTVFAPTDAAFKKLPPGTLEDLLKPENRKNLVSILTYHVVPGKVMAADVKTMEVETLNGQKLSIKVEDGNVTVNGATVIATDVAAGNGVIHAIDTVMRPPAGEKDPAAAKPKDHPAH